MTKYMAKLLSEALDDSIVKKIAPVSKETYIPPVARQEYPSTPAEAIPRQLRDILTDITNAEAERDEELANCQDNDTSRMITKTYTFIISGLWEEYRESKPTEK